MANFKAFCRQVKLTFPKLMMMTIVATKYKSRKDMIEITNRNGYKDKPPSRIFLT
ncbi:MAG: hypothetical protein ACJAV0_001045 [Shewanella sp.]